MTSFAERYLNDVAEIAQKIPAAQLDAIAVRLAGLRDGAGRLFVLGVGGGAAHASHAVNDFRKLCGLEAYAPTDNVSELTARVNDDGWETVFSEWLRTSRLSEKDGLLVFSVGGGSRKHNLSPNLVLAIELAKEIGAGVFALVGRRDGAAAQLADIAVVIDAPAEHLTPQVEGFQAVLLHLLVSHPQLATKAGTWETVDGRAG